MTLKIVDCDVLKLVSVISNDILLVGDGFRVDLCVPEPGKA